MGRKRMRRRRDPKADMNRSQTFQPAMIDGKMVLVHRIQNTDEGVLYSHAIQERSKPKRRSMMQSFKRQVSSLDDSDRSLSSSIRNFSKRSLSGGSSSPPRRSTRRFKQQSFNTGNFQAWIKNTTHKGTKQYTIKPKKRFENSLLDWMDQRRLPFMNYFARRLNNEQYDPDAHNYRPGHLLFKYINWTFVGSWSEVVLTFMFSYFVIMLIFAFFLWIAGNAQPACIVAAGAPFGENDVVDSTRFSDAFALSWTTFTTVGYGMIYTAVGGDFQPNGPGGRLDTEPHHCSWVVTLCTMEAFLGLLYAGMCAAILFGKVNRVQSHANLIFANSVCLQYEWVEEEDDSEEEEEEEDEGFFSHIRLPTRESVAAKKEKEALEAQKEKDAIVAQKKEESSKLDFDNGIVEEVKEEMDEWKGDSDRRPSLADSFGGGDVENPMPTLAPPQDAFIDQFNGCPVLKFQVVNELCNKEGAEIVDAIMKVVGIKFKGSNGRVTRSEYVRVNLVDFEHPFFSRVWHGVHVLDGSSPLLNDKAKQRIRENNGSWPSHWFRPDVIREKLEFHDLIVTVAGISNISALTVHAYKRYKIGDVLIGYTFAPLVFRDKETGRLSVDKKLVNDVREQAGLEGEDLSVRKLSVNNTAHTFGTIRIKKASDPLMQV